MTLARVTSTRSRKDQDYFGTEIDACFDIFRINLVESRLLPRRLQGCDGQVVFFNQSNFRHMLQLSK